MDRQLLLMLSSFLCGKNLRCFCVRQRDPDDDDRPSIIVMWRLIGKVVVDYFFCGYAPFIGAWQPALFRLAACLPATRRALGGARSFSFLLSLLAFVDVKTRRCHRSTRPSCKTFHTPWKAIRLLIFSNHIAMRTNTPCKTAAKSAFPTHQRGLTGWGNEPQCRPWIFHPFLSYKNWPLW